MILLLLFLAMNLLQDSTMSQVFPALVTVVDDSVPFSFRHRGCVAYMSRLFQVVLEILTFVIFETCYCSGYGARFSARWIVV
jgi:hypothetical protein